jgi:hypothetical protein
MKDDIAMAVAFHPAPLRRLFPRVTHRVSQRLRSETISNPAVGIGGVYSAHNAQKPSGAWLSWR